MAKPLNLCLTGRSILTIAHTYGTACVVIFLLAGVSVLQAADQIATRNGEKLLGKVIAVGTNTVTFESDTLGRIEVPRAKISGIWMGDASKGAVVPLPPGTATAVRPLALAPTNQPPQIANSDTEAIQNLLSTAGPEATQKYQQMVASLLSGNLSVADIRKQAKSVSDQARALRADLGDDTGVIDSYLAILDNFLRETAPAPQPTVRTNAAPVK